MTGTEKFKPFMIGKYKNPRCFASVKSYPFDYDANPKARMNAKIFAQFFYSSINNCTAHNDIPELNAIKVQFLPANLTSKLQQLDQGIIKNFKTLYRKESCKACFIKH
jgi:hypothetical protein